MTKICLAAGICLVFNCAFSQAPKTVELSERILKFYRMYPQEKAFLLTDNTVYIPGETIWYKLYLWNEDESETKVSNVAHVVVRNSGGDAIMKQHILIVQNAGHGDITLPDSLAAGLYSIEVFTNWMQNFSSSPITSKVLWISNGKQSLASYRAGDLQPVIKPEGGHITCDGSINRIAVSSGSTQGFTFELTDPHGQSAYSGKFTSAYAVANVSLSIPGVYQAKVCPVNSAVCYEENLTAAEDIAIRLYENLPLKKVMVGFSKKVQPRERWLLALTASKLVEVIHLTPGHYSDSFELRTENYPGGIVHLIVVDNRYRIESHRAFYNVKGNGDNKTIPKEHVQKTSLDDRVEVRLTSPPGAEDHFAAVIVPEDARCGSFFLKHVAMDGDQTLNDVMLFQTFYLEGSLAKFLNASYLPITHSTHTPLNKQLDHIPRTGQFSLNPIAMILSGFNNAGKADSIIAFKRDLEKIDATYYNNRAGLKYEKIAADVVYVPKDYPSMKTLTEFLRQAIPRIKFSSQHDHNEMSFLVSNLKGQKSLYPGKPAVILNGYVIPDLNTIKDLPFSEVTSIEVLYEPKTLIDSNLKNIFPYGAIAIYTSEAASTLTRTMTLNRRLFSGSLSWPHVFQQKNLFSEAADDRWPFFKTLYSWQPDLNFMRQKHLPIGEIPAQVPPRCIFLIFSLAQAKQEMLTEVAID